MDSNTYDSSNYRLPSKSPWRNNTIYYVFSRNTNIGSGKMSLASVLTYDSGSTLYNDKLFC